MSLINDTLKQLEARRQKLEKTDKASPSLLDHIKSSDHGESHSSRLLLILGSGLMLIAAAWLWKNPGIISGLFQPERPQFIAKKVSLPAQPATEIPPKAELKNDEQSVIEVTLKSKGESEKNTTTADQESFSSSEEVAMANSKTTIDKPEMTPAQTNAPAEQTKTVTAELTEPVSMLQASLPAQPTPSVKVEPQFVKTFLTKEEQAEKYLDEGLSLIQQGEYPLAEKRLMMALNAQPDHIMALETFAILKMKLGHLAEADSIINQGLALKPDATQLLKLKARIINAIEGPDVALQLLIKHAPEFTRDLEYHAFIAELYRQTGSDVKAHDIYRRLVQINPVQGRWQMGFGLTLEKMGQHKEAHLAYQRAIDNQAQLKRESVEYLKHRIRYLKRL